MANPSAAAAQRRQPPPVLWSASPDGVATITFNRPRRLNGWSGEVLAAMFGYIEQAGRSPAVKVIIITANGRYYSSGADFSDQLKGPLRPSTLVKNAYGINKKIFGTYIACPKPIIIAAQGPLIGGAVTTACSLSEYVLATPNVTMQTPFRRLGITPEGCAEYTWPLRLTGGQKDADALLKEGRKVTAHDALAMGLVNEILPDQKALMARANALARDWIAAKATRWTVVPGYAKAIQDKFNGDVGAFVKKLHAVNERESVRLAKSIMSPGFLAAQGRFQAQRGNACVGWAFWLAAPFGPLLSCL